MQTDLLKRVFFDLASDNLSFAYTGSFSDALSIKMIDLARFNIESKGYGVGMQNKVSFLMGECYQNIVRHGIGKNDLNNLHERTNLLFLRNVRGSHIITSANRVSSKTVTDLKRKLDRVNSLTADELKDIQKDILMKGEINEKGGAGIGIIQMARKTGQKLEYAFEPIDSKHSLFYLQIRLEENETAPATDALNLKSMIELHSTLANEGLLIMHKGDFSKETFLPVIKMIEGNLGGEFDRSFSSTKLYHITVEILQNISLHGLKQNDKTEGIFTLGKKDNLYVIGTSNYIDNSEAEPLKRRLQELGSLPRADLNKLYRKKLQKVIDESDFKIGLGLIDMHRFCQSLEYSLEPTGNKTLFTIIVKL